MSKNPELDLIVQTHEQQRDRDLRLVTFASRVIIGRMVQHMNHCTPPQTVRAARQNGKDLWPSVENIAFMVDTFRTLENNGN